MQHRDPNPVALVVFVSTAVAAGLVLFTIQREVNTRLPPEEHYPYFRFGRHLPEMLHMLRDHSKIYSGDVLPPLFWLLNGLSLLTWLFMVLSSMTAR
jgi:hypothetical protein